METHFPKGPRIVPLIGYDLVMDDDMQFVEKEVEDTQVF
jgi:hypothetical protein